MRPEEEASRLAERLRRDEQEVKGGEPVEEEAGVDLEPVTDESGNPEP